MAGGSTYEYPVPTGLSTNNTSKLRVHENGFVSKVRLSVKVYGPNYKSDIVASICQPRKIDLHHSKILGHLVSIVVMADVRL